MPKKEIDNELAKHDPKIHERTGCELSFLKHVVAHRWVKGSRDEAKECFNLFDKRQKNFITAQELKAVLGDYLEFPVTDAEINDFMLEVAESDSKNGSV